MRRTTKRVLKYGGYGAVGLFLAAQLVPVDRSNPADREALDAPPDVVAVLQRACYDCHSNETVWPAYSRVAPVSWLVARDVRLGREAVNYSRWSHYDRERQRELLEETWEEVAEGEMPMRPYVLMHPAAALTAADRTLLRNWAGPALDGDLAATGHDEED